LAIADDEGVLKAIASPGRSVARAGARLASIDGLRAIAVLTVLVFHAHQHGAVPDETFPVNLGARGVDLFFVISGFCLARPYLVTAARERSFCIDWGAFMIRRLARIAPPYYAALLLFAVLVLGPMHVPSDVSLATRDAIAKELPLDALFLTSPAPLINSSFWTLGVEMRWYLLCPLLVALVVRAPAIFALVGVGLAIAYGRAPYLAADFGILPCFMLGIVAAAIGLTRYASRAATVAQIAALPLLAAAIAHVARQPIVDHADTLWQLAAFAVVVAADAAWLRRILAIAPLAFVGRASYGIYLVHEPLAVWSGDHGWSWPIGVAIALAGGIAFYAFVERRLVARPVRSAIEATLASVGFGRWPLIFHVERAS